ncbi:MAG: aldo/keto reductase [Lachnospiraceae bacterium]|nr:aldo/keto reductase [Lachnospiraceae bacterium]
MANVRELFSKKLGFGLMRMPIGADDKVDEAQVCDMVDHFLNEGFKYFDTAYVYHGGESENIIKRCLVDRYPRDKFYLATKLPSFIIEKAEDMDRIFNEQLNKCGVEYFDLYLVHALNAKEYEKMNGFKAFEYVEKKRDEGKIRFVGFSFHDKAEVLDKILNDHPEVDFVQLQINYYDWDKSDVEARLCYETATKHGKPVIVMEPIKGGSLSDPSEEATKLIKDEFDNTPSALALSFVASLDNVMMVLSGMSSIEQMRENTALMKDFKPLTDKDKELTKKIVEIIDSVPTIPCTGCKYCVDGCPMKIRINGFFSLYNKDLKFGKGKYDKASYERIGRDDFGKPSDCVECGACENVCPQHITIRDNLKKIAECYE